jgi:hypothetical protein
MEKIALEEPIVLLCLKGEAPQKGQPRVGGAELWQWFVVGW